MIKVVTMTGADDSIQPEQLLELSKKYPFVEWGILISKNNFGHRRFPTKGWIHKLYDLNSHNPGVMKLSSHLCGFYVRDLAIGGVDFISDLKHLMGMFNRVQLNFHGQLHKSTYLMAEALSLFLNKEFIFQVDNVNNELLFNAKKRAVKVSALFDTSHGTGILPDKWPDIITDVKCGYAGGIGPDNIEQQMLLINSLAGQTETWIDMETKVRSQNDAKFDLYKVEECLKVAAKHIE